MEEWKVVGERKLGNYLVFKEPAAPEYMRAGSPDGDRVY
jgi:hypothetical protein